MAMNPMQRRARNSFLTGMLVTLVVMAVVVIALLYKINQLNEDMENLVALQTEVYVAAQDIKSGEEVTEDLLKKETVRTTVPADSILTLNDFVEYDEEEEVYVVEGPRIEKMLGYTNIDSEKGFEFFQNFLKTNGILEELEALGIKDGDTVRMYGLMFDYYK